MKKPLKCSCINQAHSFKATGQLNIFTHKNPILQPGSRIHPSPWNTQFQKGIQGSKDYNYNTYNPQLHIQNLTTINQVTFSCHWIPKKKKKKNPISLRQIHKFKQFPIRSNYNSIKTPITLVQIHTKLNQTNASRTKSTNNHYTNHPKGHKFKPNHNKTHTEAQK